MKTKYAIRHRETKRFFTERVNGVPYYSDVPTNTFDSMTGATVAILELGGAFFLEAVPV